jgi:hypothetical protein
MHSQFLLRIIFPDRKLPYINVFCKLSVNFQTTRKVFVVKFSIYSPIIHMSFRLLTGSSMDILTEKNDGGYRASLLVFYWIRNLKKNIVKYMNKTVFLIFKAVFFRVDNYTLHGLIKIVSPHHASEMLLIWFLKNFWI